MHSYLFQLRFQQTNKIQRQLEIYLGDMNFDDGSKNPCSYMVD